MESKIVKEAVGLINGALVLSIQSQDDLESTGKDLQVVKKRLQEVREEKEKIMSPIKEAMQACKDFFDPVIKKLESLDQALRSEVLRWESRLNDEAQERCPGQVIKFGRPEAENITTRENWDYEIEDLSKVPRNYFILDEKRMKQIARETKGMVSIPGIKFICNRSVVVRGENGK